MMRSRCARRHRLRVHPAADAGLAGQTEPTAGAAFAHSDRRRSAAALASIVLLLSGCANPGDLGRLKPATFSDDKQPAVLASSAFIATDSGPEYAFTDDEQQLRDLAFPLLLPPGASEPWEPVRSVYRHERLVKVRPADPADYAARLFAMAYRSPLGRYAKLIDDARNDITRIEQFLATARRVRDMDQKREKSLAYVSTLAEIEYRSAIERIRDNQFIIQTVHQSLAGRAMSYRFALERLVIAMPSPAAAEADRAVKQLEAHIATWRLARSLYRITFAIA